MGFNVKGVTSKLLKRGYVCSDQSNNPARVAKSYKAQVIIMKHPGQIRQGYTPVVDCHTSHIASKFVKLISKIDKRTNKVSEENPECLVKGDCAIVEIEPTKPVVVETFSTFAPLGRFAIRDMNSTVGVGIIKEVTWAEEKK